MTTEKKVIKLLEELVRKMNECSRIISEITGEPIKPTSPEEDKKYLDYVRKRIYG